MANSNSTVKLYNGASKTNFGDLSFEDQKSLYYQFQRYAVRREIAEQNMELSSIFKKVGDYSACFNAFNSAFIGNGNMIDLLNEGELDALPRMSDASFESKLANASFDRQIALICYSLRNNERIPNRVDFPVLIAYANMQNRVLDNYRKGYSISKAIEIAGRETREEFVDKHGCSMKYEYKTNANGEKYLVDRNITPRTGYSGNLGVAQSKAYSNFINSIVSDMFDNTKENAKISQALDVLVQKVCKRHIGDPEFNTNALIQELVYRFFMPTNKMKEEFKEKINEMVKTVNHRVSASVAGATEKYNNSTNIQTFNNLEKVKSEKYREEIYSAALKEIVSKSLRDNVGLTSISDFEKTKPNTKASQMGEE